METYDTFEHDILVIGAGGAGLRATIAAAESGLNVGVVCKSLLGKAHTVMAEGGIAGALANLDKKDSWQVHFMDTMRGGAFLNNWRTVEILAKEAPERVLEDRKSTRLNSSHLGISYAVFCLKKKKHR